MLSQIVNEFMTFFVVIDPFGTIPVFIAATVGMAGKDQRHVAIQAISFAASILLFFVLFGQIIITEIGVDLASFKLSGGIILFLFALTMIFGDGKPAEEMKEITPHLKRQRAIFPLAIPSIASPGAMLAAVTLTDNRDYTLAEQALTTGVLLCVLSLTLLFLLLASPIIRIIGMSGAAVISRIMGIVLAAYAVETIVEAIILLAGKYAPFS